MDMTRKFDMGREYPAPALEEKTPPEIVKKAEKCMDAFQSRKKLRGGQDVPMNIDKINASLEKANS